LSHTLLLHTNASAQINTTDSLALVSLYNTTNGPNWYIQTNWLAGPVSTWYGIETNGTQRVLVVQLWNNNLTGNLSENFWGLDSLLSLNLGYNNLTGPIPAAISSFTLMTALVLHRNHFTSPIPVSMGSMQNLQNVFLGHNDFSGTFPDTLLKTINSQFHFYLIDTNQFDSLPYVSTYSGGISCLHNRFSFEDILPYVQSGNMSDFDYNPQDSIGELMDTTVFVGDNLVLDSWCGGEGNLYRWKKDGVNVSGWDTISSLVLNNAQLSYSGYYTCEVSNPGVPLLTLNRRMIHVQVNLIDDIESIPAEKSSMLSFHTETSFLRIHLDFPAQTPVRCNLYDMTGRKVMSLFNDQTHYQDLHYYLNWLKPGIYLVNLQYANQSESLKILIR
jgi:hypothetical protein